MPNTKTPISVTAISSISPLGFSKDEVWNSYQNQNCHYLVKKVYRKSPTWVAPLTISALREIEQLRSAFLKYKNLDNSVLYALYASRKAVKQAGWSKHSEFGINIGSSRGATALFEQYHREFLTKDKVPTLTSPTTTLGNISSWVAHDLQTRGPEISHSITCSTALHSVLNGVAWLRSGMAQRFLVGGSEAPLNAIYYGTDEGFKSVRENRRKWGFTTVPVSGFEPIKKSKHHGTRRRGRYSLP